MSTVAIIRSFVALPIPEEVAKMIRERVEPFRRHDTSIKWLPSEKIHLTLKFLGGVAEEMFEENFFPQFPQLLAPFRPISLATTGRGQFPPRGVPRVLWIGLGGEVELLEKLEVAVEEFFEPIGFPREKRVFHPHLTLARIRQKPSKGFMKAWQEGFSFPEIQFCVDRVCFYRSELTKGGAVYSVLKEFKLAGC